MHPGARACAQAGRGTPGSPNASTASGQRANPGIASPSSTPGQATPEPCCCISSLGKRGRGARHTLARAPAGRPAKAWPPGSASAWSASRRRTNPDVTGASNRQWPSMEKSDACSAVASSPVWARTLLIEGQNRAGCDVVRLCCFYTEYRNRALRADRHDFPWSAHRRALSLRPKHGLQMTARWRSSP